MDEPDDEQQYDGADGGVDDRADNSVAKMDSELRQQPVADEGTDNSDYHVTNYAKTRPPDDLAGQPAGNETDQQYDEETFVRHVHGDARLV
jgi:hypothetical protein